MESDGHCGGGDAHPRALSAVARRRSSRLALLLTLAQQAPRRTDTALVAQDAQGRWYASPLPPRVIVSGLRCLYRVRLGPQPLVLGVRLRDMARSTAHVLLSYSVRDPVEVVRAGPVATRRLLDEAIATAVRAAAAANPIAIQHLSLAGTAGGVGWETRQLHLGPDLSDAGSMPLPRQAD